MAPILGQLLDDPYAAVRLIAARSLKELPGFADFDYDFLSPPDARGKAPLNAVNIWHGTLNPTNRRTDPTLLMDAAGEIRLDLVNLIKQRRDDHRMSLRE